MKVTIENKKGLEKDLKVFIDKKRRCNKRFQTWQGTYRNIKKTIW